MRHHEESATKKESNQRERDGRSQPGIDQIFVELSVHSCATGLQRAAENNEGDDPASVHLSLLSCQYDWIRCLLHNYEVPKQSCIKIAPPSAASIAIGMATAPTLRKSQKVTSSFS